MSHKIDFCMSTFAIGWFFFSLLLVHCKFELIVYLQVGEMLMFELRTRTQQLHQSIPCNHWLRGIKKRNTTIAYINIYTLCTYYTYIYWNVSISCKCHCECSRLKPISLSLKKCFILDYEIEQFFNVKHNSGVNFFFPSSLLYFGQNHFSFHFLMIFYYLIFYTIA